jgi:hypothetical protein
MTQFVRCLSEDEPFRRFLLKSAGQKHHDFKFFNSVTVLQGPLPVIGIAQQISCKNYCLKTTNGGGGLDGFVKKNLSSLPYVRIFVKLKIFCAPLDLYGQSL